MIGDGSHSPKNNNSVPITNIAVSLNVPLHNRDVQQRGLVSIRISVRVSVKCVKGYNSSQYKLAISERCERRVSTVPLHDRDVRQRGLNMPFLCVMIITPKKAPTTRISRRSIVSRNEMIQGSFSLLQSDRRISSDIEPFVHFRSKSPLGSLQGG